MRDPAPHPRLIDSRGRAPLGRPSPDRFGAGHRASRSVTQLFVPGPPIDWARATLHETWRRGTEPVSCHTHSTIGATPVAASGWPRALRPPEVLIGSRPSSAVWPSSVAGPALPCGTELGVASELRA